MYADPTLNAAPRSETPDSEPAYYPLAAVFFAAVAGILADRYGSFALSGWFIAAVVALGLWLVLDRLERTTLAVVPLLLSVVCLFGALQHLWWRCFRDDDLGRAASADSRPVCLEAIIATGPRIAPAPPPNPTRAIPQGDETLLTVTVVRVRDGSEWRPAGGAAQLFVDGHLLGVEAGDRVRIFGALAAPPPAGNSGQYDVRLAERGDRRLMRLAADHPDCIERLDEAAAFEPVAWLDRLRLLANRALWSHLTAEQSGLASTLLLGAREQLDRERLDAFFLTGTIHILAISGMHVAIFGMALFGIARSGLVPLRPALLGVAVITVVYACLTDGEPPVTRAAILVVVTCIGMWLGRRPLGLNTLALAGLVVLWINPGDLFRSGAQLSFLAAAVLAWTAPWVFAAPEIEPLDRLILAARPWYFHVARGIGRWAWTATLLTIAVWLVSMPLVMFHFHLVSPIAVPLNVLVAWPITFALGGGFLTVLCEALVPRLAFLPAWCCDAALSVTEGFVQTAAKIPGNHFFTPDVPLWWVLGIYIGWAGWVLLPDYRPPARWAIAAVALWCTAALIGPWAWSKVAPPAEEPPVACTFISVGHGTSVLIELPDGRRLLYDAGSLSSPESASRAIASVLWSRGVTHLDAVVLSHADTDHYNGLPGLLNRFSVGVVYVSPVMFDDATPALTLLKQSIESHGVPLRTLKGGDRLATSPGTLLEVLHPPAKGVLGSDNANSIVLLVEHSGRRVLLTGDLESPGLDDVLAEEPLDCDCILAPHHGSVRSNPAGFARWSTPEYVIVGGGPGPEWLPVRDAYQAAGAAIRHTSYDGSTRVELRRSGVTVRSWLREKW